MMTEAEAAMKRCPMSFGPTPVPTVTVGPGSNWSGAHHGMAQSFVPFTPSSPICCIGSACMAWRETVAAYPGDVAGVDTSTGAKYYLKGTQKPAQGVCGLVGRS